MYLQKGTQSLETSVHIINLARYEFWGSFNDFSDLAKFVLCTLVLSDWLHMMFDLLKKGTESLETRVHKTNLTRSTVRTIYFKRVDRWVDR